MVERREFRNWALQKEKLKKKFAAITANDFFSNEIKREEFYNKLQTALGLTREELVKIFSTS